MDKTAEKPTYREEIEPRRPPRPPKSQQFEAQPKAVNLRCIWSTRVVVPAERTITKRRYEFDAGQVLAVDSLDVPALLALERRQSPGCCGGDPKPPALKYFEKA